MTNNNTSKNILKETINSMEMVNQFDALDLVREITRVTGADWKAIQLTKFASHKAIFYTATIGSCDFSPLVGQVANGWSTFQALQFLLDDCRAAMAARLELAG